MKTNDQKYTTKSPLPPFKDKLKLAIIDSSDTWYAQPKQIYDEFIKMGYDCLWMARPNHEGAGSNSVPQGYITICIANNVGPIDFTTRLPLTLDHPPLERAYKSKADFVFVGDKTTFLRYFSDRPNAYYMPYAVNTDIYKPINDLDELYDIGFVGFIKLEERARRIGLIKNRFNCFIGNELFMEKANEALNSCRIIFNTSDHREINMRVFEALATGKLLVTDKVDYLDELFEDGVHLVTYINKSELKEKVSYYLKNKKKRKEIAKKGLKTVRKYHTYRHRAEFIIEKITQSEFNFQLAEKRHLSDSSNYRMFYEKQSKTNTSAQERLFDSSIPDPDLGGMYNIRGRLKEALRIAKGKVLDIGCQRGGYCANLKQAGLDVVGIDISFGYLKMAKDNTLDSKFLSADAQCLPFKNEIFDTVILSEILEHVIDEEQVVEEVSRVIKPDGAVFVTVPAYEEESEEHVRFLSKRRLTDLFKKFSISFQDNFSIRSTILIAKKRQPKATIAEYTMEKRNNNSKLNILLTNHHLLDFTGSEVFTFTIADFLKKKGHDVTILSKYIDSKLCLYFEKIGVRLTNNINAIEGDHFDVGHIHHNVMGMEVRRHFRDLPLVFLSHGVIPFLEHKPPVDISIAHYLAVSEEVKNNLIRQDINSSKVEIYRNIVDSNKFFPRKPIFERPSRALILSNKIDKKTENIIRTACKRLGILTNFVGMRFGTISQYFLPDTINNADIVFTLGRGVIESMMCGRVPIVLDYLGGDGMVTPDNIEHLMQHNFSGRTYNRKFTVDELIDEINLYEPSFGEALRVKAIELFDANIHINHLVDRYKKAMSIDILPLNDISKELIDSFLATVDTTRYFSNIETSRFMSFSKENDVNDEIDSILSNRLEKLKKQSQHSRNTLSLNKSSENTYDILIPIYNAFEYLQRCIDSVLLNTKGNHRIYLLDDCSTDERVLKLLRSYEDSNQRVSVIESAENKGFIHNVNRGFDLSQNDVVILNSDTEVTDGWLDKMDECLHSRPDIGIVCPLSNNATILSIPIMNQANSLPEGMDPHAFGRLIAEVSSKNYPELPTGVGFCMLISRDTLNITGSFDPLFGVGYGEENDLCQKARAVGKKVVCCDNAYVHHYGEASFKGIDQINEKRMKNEQLLQRRWPDYINDVYYFCWNNPLRELHERVLIRMRNLDKNVLPSILHVIHNFSSSAGTEIHTQNIINGLSSRFHNTVIYPSSVPDQWIDITEEEVNEYIRVLKLRTEPIKVGESFLGLAGDLLNEQVENVFSRFIQGGKYEVIHFQHLIGWDSLLLPIIAKHKGFKVIISLHDYYLLCPEYNLILPNLTRCGKIKADSQDSECLYCLATRRRYHQNGKPPFLNEYIKKRNHIIRNVFDAADLLIVPSDFVRKQFTMSYGDIINNKIITVPHGIDSLRKSTRPTQNKILRVGFLGNPYDRKGIFVFLQAAKLLKNFPIKFEIFGDLPPVLTEQVIQANITVHGRYTREDLPHLLCNTNLIVVPSIWDETFCLTVSESQIMGIPVLASDVGAISERIINGETGFLFPPSNARALTEKLIEIHNNPELLKKIASNLDQFKVKTIDENVEDYATVYNQLIKKEPISIDNSNSIQSSPKADIFESMKIAHGSLTSIIILCLNQLEYTKRCLQSIEEYTSVPYELIIVDNGSTDDTPGFLKEYAKEHNECKIILNKENLGFAGGNNQGIAAAKGDYILLLNNDVVVTEHWLERLIEHVESDINIGMIGPVTNYGPGPQIIENTDYGNNLEKMHAFAGEYTKKNAGRTIDILRPLGFCLLIKSHVIDIIGNLDERYGIGNYEDDDLCLRSRIAGFRNIIAHDVFIHHYGSMTFKGNSIDYDSTLQNNRKQFIDKWKGVVEEVDDLVYRFVMTGEEQINKLIEWGEIRFSEENFQSALQIFERVLQLDPNNSQALNNIGVMQWQLGNPSEAIKTFQIALNNNPEDTDALENLAQATMETGEFDFINSDLLETQINKLIEWGEDKFSKGDLDSASKIFERVIQFDPSNSQALNNIGVMQWRLGDTTEAIKTFQIALNNNPKDTDALENLTQATMETGEFDFINSDLLETLKKAQPENLHLETPIKENNDSYGSLE